ncbi:hypothetical protein [uncultured Algimonas sp.]|uniref:hypothetical protein n=1 Tax=uncultured Algimonas sp. TaxID=1547920 RepID=UPI002632B5A4|nr:hypothetical protein [uncultured Algimonas sp.]
MSVFKNKGNNKTKKTGKPSSPPSKVVSMDDKSEQTISKASTDMSQKNQTKPANS